MTNVTQFRIYTNEKRCVNRNILDGDEQRSKVSGYAMIWSKGKHQSETTARRAGKLSEDDHDSWYGE